MRIKVLGCSGAEYPGSNSPAFLLDDGIRKMKLDGMQLLRDGETISV